MEMVYCSIRDAARETGILFLLLIHSAMKSRQPISFWAEEYEIYGRPSCRADKCNYCDGLVTLEEGLHSFYIDESLNLKHYDGDDLQAASEELGIPFSQLWDAAKTGTTLIHLWNPRLFDIELRYIKAWVSNAHGNELEKYKYLS